MLGVFEPVLLFISGVILLVYGYIGFRFLPPIGLAKTVKWLQVIPMFLGILLLFESAF